MAKKKQAAAPAEPIDMKRVHKKTMTRPAGSSALWAAWRTGLKDLQDHTKAFPDSHRSPDELGSIANPTSQDVFRGQYDAEAGDSPLAAKRGELQAEVNDLEQDRDRGPEPEM